MFQCLEDKEGLNSYAPLAHLYNMCKSKKNSGLESWFNSPNKDDENSRPDMEQWAATPACERELENTESNYLSSFFLDYHHELQLQQWKLQNQLQQLQLLEHLLHPSSSTNNNCNNHSICPVNYPRVVGPNTNMTQDPSTWNEFTPPTTASTVRSEPEVIPSAASIISANDFSQWLTEENDTFAIPPYIEKMEVIDNSKLHMELANSNNNDAFLTRTPEKSPLDPDRRTSVSTISSTSTTASHRYICNECGKGFARASSLRTHRNIHTGDRPFTCPYKNCGKSFNARSNMLRHHKLHFKTDCGLYRLPNGETTNVKPSSRKLFALSK